MYPVGCKRRVSVVKIKVFIGLNLLFITFNMIVTVPEFSTKQDDRTDGFVSYRVCGPSDSPNPYPPSTGGRETTPNYYAKVGSLPFSDTDRGGRTLNAFGPSTH